MMSKLTTAEVVGYLGELRAQLMAESARFRGAWDFHAGRCREDAVQQVLLEVGQHLATGSALPRTKHANPAVDTLPQLTTWALHRLATVFNTLKRTASRRLASEIENRDALPTSPSEPLEHPIYDSEFLTKFLAAISDDPIAHRFVLLIIASHIIPGVDDIDPCDNTAIAELLGCKPGDVRNARKRIDTIKNRLIARRTDNDREGPAR